MRIDRVPNDTLLECGLELMRQSGKPLTKLHTKGRSMLYEMESGETVRVRTGNDHILLVVAKGAQVEDNINIEGTDWLLVVMPEKERTYGPVIAYLVPTELAVKTVRENYADWLATHPNTKGNNTTRNIWFGPRSKSGGFSERWKEFRLEGHATTEFSPDPSLPNEPLAAPSSTLGEVIAAARESIAGVAGVPPSAVRISVDLT